MFSAKKQSCFNRSGKNACMGYGSRLQQAMSLRKRDRAWLAASLGISVQAVGSVLSEHTKALKAENHELAARCLGVSGMWLATGEGEMIPQIEPVDSKQIPLLDWVSAGNWAISGTQAVPEEMLPCPMRCGPRTYALRIKGQSMYAPGAEDSFAPGEVIFVDPDIEPLHGDFVVVRLDDSGEATFKRLLIEGGQRLLEAINPAWPERIIKVNGNASFCGVYLGSWKPSRRRG